MSVKFIRVGNADSSYTYTDADGIRYEILNLKGYGERDEWRICKWETNELVAVFDTLRECREWFS